MIAAGTQVAIDGRLARVVAVNGTAVELDDGTVIDVESVAVVTTAHHVSAAEFERAVVAAYRAGFAA